MSDQRTLKQWIQASKTLRILRAPPITARSEIEALVALESFDMFWLDGQHTPLCEREIFDFCRMAEELGKPVQLRVKHPRQGFEAYCQPLAVFNCLRIACGQPGHQRSS